MAKIWATLFAAAGDKQVIPVPPDAGGSVSVTQGWTPDYELPNTDPDYKPVGREEMNGAFNEVTESIQQLQLQGAAEWSVLLGAYPKGAEVIHAGERWFSPVAGNTTEPGAVGATWILSPSESDFTRVGIKGSFSNLRLSSTGLSAIVLLTADEFMVEKTGNNYKTLRAVSLSISLSASGLNGLDTGSSAASTWYAVHVIHDPTTNTTGGILSLSSTSPTMPAGYTYAGRAGWIRTDGTANKYPLSFMQRGNEVTLKVATGSNVAALPMIAFGALGSISTPTWTTQSLSAYCPATAISGKFVLSLGAALGTMMVAPNNSYGKYDSPTNPPPVVLGQPGGGTPNSALIDMPLETASICVAFQNASNFIQTLGWKDSL